MRAVFASGANRRQTENSGAMRRSFLFAKLFFCECQQLNSADSHIALNEIEGENIVTHGGDKSQLALSISFSKFRREYSRCVFYRRRYSGEARL